MNYSYILADAMSGQCRTASEIDDDSIDSAADGDIAILRVSTVEGAHVIESLDTTDGSWSALEAHN